MSSLSSVVSNLVRAQMGTAVSPQVTDDDLDKAVAELILKEAKKKAERFGQDGIRAYLRSGMCVLFSFLNRSNANWRHADRTATPRARTSGSCRPSSGAQTTTIRRFCKRRHRRRRN
jgi:hypothetical protein